MMGTSLASSLGFALTTLIALASSVALLVLALTVVRKARPDAAGLLTASGALQTFIVIARALSFMIIPYLASSYGGATAVVELNAALSVGWALLGAFAAGLLLAGIYRLAQPASGELG